MCSGVEDVVPLAIAFGVASGGGAFLSRFCFSEMGVLFAAQGLLLLLWCCARRPVVLAAKLYLFTCVVLLARETVLVWSGRVPCGLSTFQASCLKSECAEWYTIPFVGIKTSCKQQACVEHKRMEVTQVFFSPSTWNIWTVSALVGVWLAFILSACRLHQWHRRERELKLQGRGKGKVFGCVAVVLMVPVTYGYCALESLRALAVDPQDTWQAEGMMSGAEFFSAFALYAFQALLVVYVEVLEPSADMTEPMRDSRYEASDAAERSSGAGSSVPSRASQHAKLHATLRTLINAGIMQYVILVFGCNAMQMVAKTWNWLHPELCKDGLATVAQVWFPNHVINMTLNQNVIERSSHTHENTIACEDLWNTVSLLMVVANFFTCSIALYAVLQYEQTFSAMLRPVRPFWKFLGVKGLLSVNFMQRIVLVSLGLMATKNTEDSEHFRTFLNFFAICLESPLLAMLNLHAYSLTSHTDYEKSAQMREDVEISSLPNEQEMAEVMGKTAFE